MIKKLLSCLALTFLVSTPAFAKLDPGTWQLLRTVGKYVKVKIDPRECNNNYYGSWDSRNKILIICTHNDGWDANDHDTARHEVWHIIQQCHNPGQRYLQPVMATEELFNLMVRSHVVPFKEQQIRSMYPAPVEDAEVEAFIMANQLSAEQIERKFLNACVE